MSDIKEAICDARVVGVRVHPEVTTMDGSVLTLQIELQLQASPGDVGRLVPGQRIAVVVKDERDE